MTIQRHTCMTIHRGLSVVSFPQSLPHTYMHDHTAAGAAIAEMTQQKDLDCDARNFVKLQRLLSTKVLQHLQQPPPFQHRVQHLLQLLLSAKFAQRSGLGRIAFRASVLARVVSSIASCPHRVLRFAFRVSRFGLSAFGLRVSGFRGFGVSGLGGEFGV